jgi:hypothetical protein
MRLRGLQWRDANLSLKRHLRAPVWYHLLELNCDASLHSRTRDTWPLQVIGAFVLWSQGTGGYHIRLSALGPPYRPRRDTVDGGVACYRSFSRSAGL